MIGRLRREGQGPFLAANMKQSLLLAFVLLVPSLLFAAPERWAKAIDELTQNDATQPPEPGGVVFVGSSSIVGWKSLAEDFPGENVIRRGFGGSELEDSVAYADRIVIPYKPRIVVLYSGDNDLAGGETPEEVLGDFRDFVAKVHDALPDTRIVFIAMKPSGSRWSLRENYEKANALIQAECEQRPELLRFVDVWTPMLGEDGTPRPELFVKDRLHLSRAGYDLWRQLVAPALR